MQNYIKDWFEVTKIDSTTFAISETKHWEKTNCYLLIGEEKACLIDSGTGIANIKAITDELTDKEIILLTTHAHWDHTGNHAFFKNKAIHSEEVSWLENGLPFPERFIRKMMYKAVDLSDFPKDYNKEITGIYKGSADLILNDGDFIELGNRKLEIIHTPGHSPGHICIKDNNKLFTGDLIYYGTIFINFNSTNPNDYYNSIRKLINLQDLSHIYPGHHRFPVRKTIIPEILEQMDILKFNKKFTHGTGLFTFNDFSIQL